jgi:hemoglobin/transferrin/lactoferrin receptor protein
MQGKAIRKRICAAAGFAAAAATAWGQMGETTERRIEMPKLTVTGTRLAEEPFEQPYAFYRASGEDLWDRVGPAVLDRVNYGPGVFVQRTAPNQASPFIRGLTGEQALLMLDGVRLSHAMMRPGPNQYAALVPDMSIDAVDAILGSSSTVNGSDGLTGALDIRLAPAGRGVESAASPWIASRVDSGNGGTVQFGVDGVSRNWAYSVEFSGSSFHDRVGGAEFRKRVFSEDEGAYEEIPNTGYDERSGGLRAAYFGLDDHLVELDAGHLRQLDAPRPDGYAENTGRADRRYRYFDPQEFTYVHLRDRWTLQSPLVERLQTTLWWHRIGEEQFRSSIRNLGEVSESVRRREYEDVLDAYGLDLQATTILGAEAQHELTWGGTFIYETTANEYRDLRTADGMIDPALLAPYKPEDWSNNATLSDGSEYTTLGLFAQDDWRFARGWSLLTGLRYSRMDWSFGDVEGGADDVTGSVRGQWDASTGHRLFAGVSRGFRAPNLTNLDGASDRGSSGQPARGNPDLDPELSYTVEAGWKWRSGRNGLALTAFHTDIEDLIQRDFSGDAEFTNIEGAEIRGFETAWDCGVEFGDRRLALVGAMSLVDATRDIPLEGGGTVEDNLSRANRLYGRVGIRYEQSRNWWGLVQVRWHDDYDDIATHPSDADADDIRMTVAGNPDGSMPGYGAVDFLCGWHSDDGRRRIGLFIENIADETYREPGSGVDGVGRNIGLTASVRL